MVMVSRRIINQAKKTYKVLRHRLKEYDAGPNSFERRFLMMDALTRDAYHFGKEPLIALTDLAAAKIRIITTVPINNVWVMLKIADVRYKAQDESTSTEDRPSL